MTYSIIARDEQTGAIGIAVASRFFACGAAVPYVGQRSAVATQAFVNPLWGTEGLARLEQGEGAAALLAEFVARDEGRDIRQCHMLDAAGNFVAHTGSGCVDHASHRCGASHSVAGNMLVGPDVIRATYAAFAATRGMSLPDRLLTAMRVGEDAGGDKRGRQAAGLLIHRGEKHAWLDLRVDDHADPLSELQRLLDVAQERYLHVAEAMATQDNFSGTIRREGIDAAIRAAEDRRRAEGIPSRSHASDTEQV